MNEVIELVQDETSIRKAATIKELKYPTLFRYVCKRKVLGVKMGKLKFRQNYECRIIFYLEQEKALVEYIHTELLKNVLCALNRAVQMVSI
jgi:hypothetical protein